MPENPQNTRPKVKRGVISPGSLNPKLSAKRRLLPDVEELVKGILGGDRILLGRAITMVESQKYTHQRIAQEVIQKCLPHAGKSIRIGITGTPGVGKSTFIESFGQHLITEGCQLAVLAIDPSSQVSKGSILGDKTRMEQLSSNLSAFIRPSPAGDSLGGVARKTRESILLCEAAGYDTILVETVGVGQSETAVHSMVDFFLLLLLPGGGDELQGIKRGIVEMADLIAVNKADGDRLKLAKHAKRAYQNALHLFPPKENDWIPKVEICSAISSLGIPAIWQYINDYKSHTEKNGFFEKNRVGQAKYWLYETISQRLQTTFFESEIIKKALPDAIKSVTEGKQTSFQIAEGLLNAFLGSNQK